MDSIFQAILSEIGKKKCEGVENKSVAVGRKWKVKGKTEMTNKKNVQMMKENQGADKTKKTKMVERKGNKWGDEEEELEGNVDDKQDDEEKKLSFID